MDIVEYINKVSNFRFFGKIIVYFLVDIYCK